MLPDDVSQQSEGERWFTRNRAALLRAELAAHDIESGVKGLNG